MTASGCQNILHCRSIRYLVVLLATAAVYWTTLDSGFVQWDDSLLTENLALRGFSADHLRAVLLPKGGAYQPVRNLAFSATYHFSKLEPFGYHLVNFLLYLMVVALAFRVLEVLAGYSPGREKVKQWAPWLGAGLFALHPLHVEGVAWIQGNKELLVSLFFLSAFLSYEKYARAGRGLKYYWLSYLLFLLALGSKPTAVAFPLVLLAFDLVLRPAAPGKKSRSRLPASALLVRYLPYLIPAALLSVYFIFFTAALDKSKLTLENIFVIPEILWNYYRLILFPVGLMHRYLDPAFQGLADFGFLAGAASTAAILYFAFRKARKSPLISFGIFWFYICWLPQSNLVPIAIRVADRYIFLSLLGVCLVAAVLLSGLLAGATAGRKTAVAGILVIALCTALAFLSANRCRVWYDGESLWSDSVDKEPRASFFRRGLAEAYLAKDSLEPAFKAFERASVISAFDARALTSMGYIRKKQGRLEEAEGLYRRAISVDSTNYNAFNSLANIYARQGKDSLAIQYYQRAINLNPGNYMARYNLSVLLRNLGRTQKADSLIQELEKVSFPQPVILLKRGTDFISDGMPDSAKVRFERALALDADLTQARAKLGEVYLRQDSLGPALTLLRRALAEGVPEWSLYNNLGLVFFRWDMPDSALYYYRQAYGLEPDSASATLNLAVLLNRKGSTGEAISLVERLLETAPDNFMAHYNLGNWLTGSKRYPEAAAHYLRAIDLSPGNANLHLNLGLLYIKHLDRPGLAARHLERALILEPQHPQALSIRQTLNFLQSRPD